MQGTRSKDKSCGVADKRKKARNERRRGSPWRRSLYYAKHVFAGGFMAAVSLPTSAGLRSRFRPAVHADAAVFAAFHSEFRRKKLDNPEVSWQSAVPSVPSERSVRLIGMLMRPMHMDAWKLSFAFGTGKRGCRFVDFELRKFRGDSFAEFPRRPTPPHQPTRNRANEFRWNREYGETASEFLRGGARKKEQGTLKFDTVFESRLQDEGMHWNPLPADRVIHVMPRRTPLGREILFLERRLYDDCKVRMGTIEWTSQLSI